MGPIRESSKISITLTGGDCVCCAGGRNLAGATNESFRRALVHQPVVYCVYTTIGTGRDYYNKYHRSNSTGKCFISVLHEYDYPRLRRYLYANSLPHCPICVSLAPNRNYFIRSEWGNSWSLRFDIEDDIGIDNSRLSNCGRCSVRKELRRL